MAFAPEITVLQTTAFKAVATPLIGTEGIDAIAEYLVANPLAGDVIQEASGARKLRWAAKGKGKRGGARVIYLYLVIATRIYLIDCYAKNEKSDLSPRDKKRIGEIIKELKEKYHASKEN